MQLLETMYLPRWKYPISIVIAIMVSIGFCNTAVGDFRSFRFLLFLVLLLVLIQLLCIDVLVYCLLLKGPLLHIDRLIQSNNSRKIALFLILSWSVYLVAYFPGVLSFDTSFQLAQFFGNPSHGIFPMTDNSLFTDHHPIFTTFIMGSVIKLMHCIFSYNLSLWLLCFLMAFVQASLFAWQLSLLSSIIDNRRLLTLLYLFYCVFPAFAYFCCVPCKDIIFCICLIGFLNIWISMYVKTPTLNTFILFFLYALLCALSKKTTIYVFVLVCIVLLFVHIPAKRGMFVSLIGVICVVQVLIPLFLFPLFSISKGSVIETLGPLYQCTARYCKEYPGDVPDEEKAVIDSMLGYDGLGDRYDYRLADNVIHYWDGVDQWPSSDKLKAYLVVFVKQGLRHPDAYLRAFLSQESGWFSFDEYLYFPEGSGCLLVSPENGQPSFERPAIFQSASSALSSALHLIVKLPFIGLFFSPITYLVSIVLILANSIVSCKLDRSKCSAAVIWLCIPILCMVPFLLLSPTSMVSTNFEAVRYFLPFIYSVPLLLVMSKAKLKSVSV